MNFLETIQRRDAIDEDKKLSKRVLDNNFTFIKNLSEETQPPSQFDKRTEFNILKMIEQLGNEANELYAKLDLDYGRYENGDIDNININVGSIIYHWNVLVSYIQSFVQLNRLSQREYEELWSKIDDRVYGNIKDVSDYIEVLNIDKIKFTFDLKDEFNKLTEYLDNQNLSTIGTATKGNTFRPSKDTSQMVFESPEQKEFNRLTREAVAEQEERLAREQLEAQKALRKKMLSDRTRPAREARMRKIQERRAREAVQEEMPALEVVPAINPEFNPYEGFGKKKRMNKKKMDEDVLQIEMEIKQKKDLNHNNKVMEQKVNKAKNFLYNDSNDSGYLK